MNTKVKNENFIVIQGYMLNEMKLKGNEKTLNGQLLLLPVIKTDEDTVQIVTSYRKIFIRRYSGCY